ncbi:uncharacterized protein [Dermacentor andersoni]|uniref:uncharacterized protein isoform X1 n=1 Tax=Dermacentor andersoni TaxID=34620 RepID=UPI002417CBB2|nr:myeloid leukemia factor-like isoform X1 [Dermacentor andersoni]
MALFGSLMRDLDSDPFFGPFEGMRQMEAMLGPMLGAFPGIGGTRRSASLGLFPTDMFSTIGRLSQDPNCHSFSSSSVMTMTTDENGRPQVYQATQSTRTAPGGVKETRRSLQDSRSGLQELTIGHHLDDRAHIVGRKRNRLTGEEDQSVEYVNLDEVPSSHSIGLNGGPSSDHVMRPACKAACKGCCGHSQWQSSLGWHTSCAPRDSSSFLSTRKALILSALYMQPLA